MLLASRRHLSVWASAAAIGGVLAAGGAGIDAQTPAKRALTIEDYYRVQSVGGPNFSPDSRWILFSVSTRVEADQGTKSESYVVPVDGAVAPRRIQHEGADVTGAAWTPTGQL
ncbi:MAG TPA: hypothetical protein VH679_08595, partial [Vicinamibacterales bacterium]